MNDTAEAVQSWDPARYRGRAGFVSELGAPLLDLLAPAPGERVLDLGCGSGELTAQLAARGAEVLGVDRDPAMVEAARERHPGVRFEVRDGQALAFEAEFEAVFSNAALHWMTRADDVAAGVARALAPGGRFVAELGGAGCVATVRHATATWLRENGVEAATYPWYFPTPVDYGQVLARAGLFVQVSHWFERPTPMPGERGLSDWLEVFAAPLLASLGARRDEFLRDVSARCRAALFRDGSYWLDYTRLRVVARKTPVPA